MFELELTVGRVSDGVAVLVGVLVGLLLAC